MVQAFLHSAVPGVVHADFGALHSHWTLGGDGAGQVQGTFYQLLPVKKYPTAKKEKELFLKFRLWACNIKHRVAMSGFAPLKLGAEGKGKYLRKFKTMWTGLAR